MKIRTKLATAGAVLALAAGVAAPAADAVTGSGTTATITLTSTGALSISEPASTVNLGSTASAVGSWTSGALGTVTVTDARTGLLSNTWAATAAVSDFTYVGTVPTGATTEQTTLPAATMLYNVGTPTPGAGNPAGAAFTPLGGAVAANSVGVGSMVALGKNSESWSPTLTVALTNQLAGTYTGTIVHSAI